MNTFEEDEVLGKAYDARLMKRFLGYVRPHWKLVATSLLIILGGIAASLAGPFILRAAIDGPIQSGDIKGLWLMGGLLFMTIVFSSIFEFAEHYLSNLAGQRIIYDVRTETYNHLQRLPAAYHDRNPVGRLLVRVTNDVENLSELFTSGLVTIFSDILLIVGLSIAMFIMDWRMALITISVVPIIIIAVLLFRRHFREAYRESRRTIARLNAYLSESVGGVKTIQIFNREQTCFDKFEERNRDYRDKSIRAVFIYSFFWPGIMVISAVALAAILWYASGAIAAKLTTFGSFIAFWWLTEKLFEPVRELAEKYNILQAAMASSERIFKLLDTPVDIAAPAEPVSPPRRGELEFRNVNFSYDGKTPVLKNVSFRVNPGEKIAVVGYTGAGKTTLINLLLRLYDAQSGSVRVDGADVREFDPADLRRRFGLVLQDVFLFSGTVEENLRLGEDIPREKLEKAVRLVKADRFIEKLPKGYETLIHERGSALSTGERQLLSLARALVFDPQILILDEATSSVDAETEGLIQEAMDRMLENRTVLMVAHRLSTVRRADRILVLHNGEVREEGTHEELVRKAGLYEKLCRLQWQPAAT